MAGRMPLRRPQRGPGREGRSSSRAVLGLLVLASLTIITVDAQDDGQGSPVAPLRTLVGAVLGPAERTATDALDPVLQIPEYFGDMKDLRRQNADLRTKVSQLQEQLDVAPAQRHRDAEITGLQKLADTQGYDVQAAQVIAMGPRQTFRQTVTIDAGSDQGIEADQMVINADGLVGRVVSVGPSTSTVLLIVDRSSTVGGRLSDSAELGFLDGDGTLSSDGRLTFKLVDHAVTPHRGDPVLTWGSRNGAPYLAGVPIGWVESVHTSPADLTETARVVPYVNFSSLDVVGVVTGKRSDTSTRQAAEGGRR